MSGKSTKRTLMARLCWSAANLFPKLCLLLCLLCVPCSASAPRVDGAEDGCSLRTVVRLKSRNRCR
jgi:hypothetical protein